MSRVLAVLAALSLLALGALGAPAASATPATTSVPPPPKLPLKAAIVTVLGTGQQLYGLNANQELPIASATKLMTALQTLERARLGQIFRDPDYHPAAADSVIGLIPGEPMSVRDLMVAMLVPSADDAAEDLAFNVGGGSIPRFLRWMNQGAQQLGLSHTHYTTPIGLDTPGNYSSASDLVKLAAYLLDRYPFFKYVVGLPHAVLTTGYHPLTVVARNTLLGVVPWIHGVKTGHTQDAGYVLVADGTRNGMTLLSAVLGTPSEAARNSTTLALLDWGFAHFRLATPIHAGAVIARPSVNDYSSDRVSVVAAKSASWVIPRGTRLRLRLKLPHNVNGPKKRNALVGTASLLEGDKTVGQVPLLLARSVPGLSSLQRFARFITKPITIVLLIAVIAMAIATLALWRSRRRTFTAA